MNDNIKFEYMQEHSSNGDHVCEMDVTIEEDHRLKIRLTGDDLLEFARLDVQQAIALLRFLRLHYMMTVDEEAHP